MRVIWNIALQFLCVQHSAFNVVGTVYCSFREWHSNHKIFCLYAFLQQVHIERNAFESWCYPDCIHCIHMNEPPTHGKLPRFNYLINDCDNIVGVATIITWPLVDCNRRIVGRRQRMDLEEMPPNWWKSAKLDSSRMCLAFCCNELAS